MSSTEGSPVRLFFLTRLKGATSHDDFEEFVTSDLLPRVREFESVISYQAYRIEDYTFEDERREQLPCDYVDVVDVTDVELYTAEVEALLASDWGETFASEWSQHVLEDFPVYGTSLGERTGQG